MAIKNTERFSELEFCLSQYFNRHVAPIMTSVQHDLKNKQFDEIENYQKSTAGILNALADASQMMPGLDTSYQKLQITGEWNSKTTDDYLDMVRGRIAADRNIQKDIAVLASEWRKAVIDEVGRDTYDNASRQIGADLAYAYIDYYLEDKMMGKMVSDSMPKSSIEYVLRKAGERSILGLDNMMRDCPADREINSRIEAKYKPSAMEKGAVRGTAFAMDVIAMGGVGSWASLARMAGAEVVFAGLESYSSDKNAGKKNVSVEECISQGIFGSNTNVFTAFRKDANIVRTWEHPALISINRQLTRKLPVLETKPMFADVSPVYGRQEYKPAFDLGRISPEAPSRTADDGKDIPSVIAIGKEEEYREFLRRNKQQQSSVKPKEEKKSSEVAHLDTRQDTPIKEAEVTASVQQQTELQGSEKQQETNLSGWDGLLQSFGLDGLSATGHNLGYVIAMLPDVLFGALTGTSKNLGLEDNLIPIASVLAGLFVRNPLLKMTLIGLGGANLISKVGKEALASQVQPVQSVRYRQYADEPLNSRITGASIQGNALLCSIDKVPCTISLPPATVAAYQAGALPLNTLANAVLQRHDAMQEELALSYQQQYEHARQQMLGAGIK